jgi:hypothetical protein
MELIELLQKLKTIKPAPHYSRLSRERILNLSGEKKGLFSAAWQLILRSLQFGSALALATILIMLVVGGFAVWKSVSHVELGSLNPSSLRAEAEAIDVQIQLTNIVYPRQENAKTTPQTAIFPKTLRTEKISEGLLEPAPSSSPAPTITIDEALDRLAE